MRYIWCIFLIIGLHASACSSSPTSEVFSPYPTSQSMPTPATSYQWPCDTVYATVVDSDTGLRRSGKFKKSSEKGTAQQDPLSNDDESPHTSESVNWVEMPDDTRQSSCCRCSEEAKQIVLIAGVLTSGVCIIGGLFAYMLLST